MFVSWDNRKWRQQRTTTMMRQEEGEKQLTRKKASSPCMSRLLLSPPAPFSLPSLFSTNLRWRRALPLLLFSKGHSLLLSCYLGLEKSLRTLSLEKETAVSGRSPSKGKHRTHGIGETLLAKGFLEGLHPSVHDERLSLTCY